LETAIADAKKALEEGGVERLNNAFSELQTSSHKLAEALYQQGGTGGATGGEEQASAAGASTGAAGGTSSGGGDDNVIDAEYVDVDENK
jgi:molecular chaperone DnaK